MLKLILKSVLRKVNDNVYNKETTSNKSKAYYKVGNKLQKSKRKVSKKKASLMYKKELYNLNKLTKQKHSRREKSIDDI